MISCIKRHNNYEEELAKPYEPLELKISKATKSQTIEKPLGHERKIFKIFMIHKNAHKILQLKQKNWIKMTKDLL